MTLTSPAVPQTPARRHLMDEMRVDLPEGVHGACEVRRFTVGENSIENVRNAFHGRDTRPGEYTMITRRGGLWMSDTDAERRDHISPASRIVHSGGRVLIGGLGLGCILRVALLTPTVSHVDVVEIDPDVVALVGPHYQRMAEERAVALTIHEADLFEVKWAPGTRWDVAWFDIWPSLCTDDLAEMARLRRSYGRRSGWNDCWGREILLRRRAQGQYSGWAW